jgi:hypothetical protein
MLLAVTNIRIVAMFLTVAKAKVELSLVLMKYYTYERVELQFHHS